MIRYIDNPNLKLKTVKTVQGATEYRRNCRLIKDKYYVVNEQCFEVEGKWYVSTSKMITFDYEKKVWVLVKDTPLVFGVVGLKSNGEAELGYFTENKYNNVVVAVPNYGHLKALDEDTLIKNNHAENISEGVWYNKTKLTPAQIANLGKIVCKKVYKEKGYNIEDNPEEFKQKIEAYNKYPVKVGGTLARYGRLLGNTTYGFENETATGYVPDNVQWRTGVIICRDGSIDNAEYVTIPMKGAKGLKNINTLGTELSKRTTIDIKCSFHIHLGTLSDDRLFLVSLYALSMKLQDEIFQMFPYYKTEWKNFKKQNYNQKLRKLGIERFKGGSKEVYSAYVDDGYYRIQKFLNDGNDADDLYNRQNHQHMRRNKWERKARYYWINFMNMFFSDRKTIEFRLHHATTNAQKMTSWLFICNAIVKYAQANAGYILSTENTISLDTVMDYYAATFHIKEGIWMSAYLKAYIADRKAYFAKDVARGDFESRKEEKEDKDFKFDFSIEGTAGLF